MIGARDIKKKGEEWGGTSLRMSHSMGRQTVIDGFNFH